MNLKVKPEKERVAFKHGVIEWMVDQQKCSSADGKAYVRWGIRGSFTELSTETMQ